MLEVSHDFNAYSLENSVFHNSHFKCIEQGVFRIQRTTFSRCYVVNLEKCEIVLNFWQVTVYTPYYRSNYGPVLTIYIQEHPLIFEHNYNSVF